MYQFLTEKEIRVIEDFPMPTEEEKAAVNAMFRPYLFYREGKDGRYFTSSCCGQGETFVPWESRTMRQSDYERMLGGHDERASCPWCGQSCQLKKIGRLGKRKKLLEYVPVVFLKERAGELLALAAWARKDYQGALEAAPLYHIAALYRFRPGVAEKYENWNGRWDAKTVSGSYGSSRQKITEPFTEGGYFYSYCAYRVIGQEAIGKSEFRYCGYEKYRQRGEWHTRLMGYLAACCIYPRNIEMLVKSGNQAMLGLVEDLVEGRRKNAALIQWGEEDPRRAFGLNGQEWKTWAGTGFDMESLELYKKMRRWKWKPDFQWIASARESFGYEVDEFLKLCRYFKAAPRRAMRYIEKNTPQCWKGGITFRGVWHTWRDWCRMAESLGYDLKEESVLFPRELQRRHDEAAAELERLAEIQRAREKAEADERERRIWEEQRKVLMGRTKKYNFAMDGWFIRVAETAEEIRAEGKWLHHCVGGYAGRHIEGKLTICFMRSVTDPGTPYVTIEMQGDKIIQAHGYKNDVGKEGPRTVHKEFFDTWLAWVKAGSPRKKDGTPKIRKKKETCVA